MLVPTQWHPTGPGPWGTRTPALGLLLGHHWLPLQMMGALRKTFMWRCRSPGAMGPKTCRFWENIIRSDKVLFIFGHAGVSYYLMESYPLTPCSLGWGPIASSSWVNKAIISDFPSPEKSTVSEWMVKLNGLFGRADIRVLIVHTSCESTVNSILFKIYISVLGDVANLKV